MRLSTLNFYTGSLSAMQQQSAALAKLQNQVAIGRKVNSPADDPIAAVHIQELERAQAESEQFAKNSTLAQNRLKIEEQSLADTLNILQRVRELTVQGANTGTLSANDRRSIATEIASRLEELQAVANRQDGNGDYLFAGYSARTQPFIGGGTAPVTYAGDQGARLIQIGPTQRVADGHSGYDVFMNIPEANGVFATSGASTNAGTGVIDVGSVVDRSAWVPDDYTITFTTATTYTVTDGATPANTIATGTYTAGSPIDFNGVRVAVSGAPQAGDSFAVTESRSESLFDTLGNLSAALSGTNGVGLSNAQLDMQLHSALQQIDTATDHILSVRGEVGARLSTLESVDGSRESSDIDLASALSELRDLDYADALTKMNQRLVGLQAAQLSYSQISQLSLFNYLK